MNCIFCRIIEGKADASIVHSDEKCIAFMNLRPINSGDFMVVPREHIDHFTDVPDELALHVFQVALHFGRQLRREFKPERVGYVVHGYGVPHAHLNVVAQHSAFDIISSKHLSSNDTIKIGENNMPAPSRSELDSAAEVLRQSPFHS
jgi:histidine triad (HIT) family protein